MPFNTIDVVFCPSADLKVTFYTAYLTAGHKYVLPVKISSVSLYEIAEKNSVLFFGVNAK